MILSEPVYEALHPADRAAWHFHCAMALTSTASHRASTRFGVARAAIMEEANHAAEKHCRTARRILWSAEFKARKEAA